MKDKTYILKYAVVCTLCKKQMGSSNKDVKIISCVKCSSKIPIKIPELYGK